MERDLNLARPTVPSWLLWGRACIFVEGELMKRRSPQEKKRLSYAKDRRNDYGENDKSSRKNVPPEQEGAASRQ